MCICVDLPKRITSWANQAKAYWQNNGQPRPFANVATKTEKQIAHVLHTLSEVIYQIYVLEKIGKNLDW